jgi:hypothetical protein
MVDTCCIYLPISSKRIPIILSWIGYKLAKFGNVVVLIRSALHHGTDELVEHFRRLFNFVAFWVRYRKFYFIQALGVVIACWVQDGLKFRIKF